MPRTPRTTAAGGPTHAATPAIPTRPARITRLTLDEARGLMLAAQGLFDPPDPAPDRARLAATFERLGVVQVDTISVVERSQYLVLWSRLGAYDPADFDALLHPHRQIFEYWGHAASIVPMRDYPYYRRRMLNGREQLWAGDREWSLANPETLARTVATIRERGPLASGDFERPGDGRRATAWDWYGVKDSRRALQILWTLGDLMVHSRRAGQKVYELRERVLAEVYGAAVPPDEAIPAHDDYLTYFARQTVRALGVVLPSWLLDYFRLAPPDGATKRATAAALLERLAAEGAVVPATIQGVREPAYIDRARLGDLKRLRGGARPARTTLLSPFDSLIWDRARTRALWDYEVCFEAYVLPAKRRYGYYCLAILHHGRLVGRLDPKMDRATRHLAVRAVYLEPGIAPDDALVDGLAGALRDLARFLGAERISVERGEPQELASALSARLAGGV
ncbi:MAG TPA: crosslink repair DNA glycosylase YcaQ family protein [Ktedonobacterales bacterium]